MVDPTQANRTQADTSSAQDHARAGGVKPEGRSINLRDLGFVGHVSDAARAEIRAAERRAARVLTTSHLYWFEGSNGRS